MTVTLAPATATDSAWDEGVTVGLDPEADVGFFSMSPASAEQVTVQIRTVLDRAWEFIALAYKGRAFLALGYGSWDEYVDARFGDLKLAVPREHRNQVVSTLAGSRMSVRAIAKLLGVGVAAVHRELVRAAGGPAGMPEPLNEVSTLGRDGKTYPRDLRAARHVCPTCGEVHPDRATDCPWDLFAQGLGPHPGGSARPDTGPAVGEDDSAPADSALLKTGRRMAKPVKHRVTSELALRPAGQPEGGTEANFDDLLGRLQGVLKVITDFAGMVTLFETLWLVGVSTTDDLSAVAARIGVLAGGMCDGIAAWSSLVDRLERVAEDLRPHC